MTQGSELITQQLLGAVNVNAIWGGIVINVKAKPFGAAGDGVTDDTKAIQGAIDYAISIGKHEVTFPVGEYLYGTLFNTSGITFVGDGVTLNGTTPITLVSSATINSSVVALKADIAKVYMMATQLGMVADDPTKAATNYAALDAYINGGTDRVVFLNGGKFWISQKLVMTQRATSILGNNKGKDLSISCLAGNFADTVFEINIPSGANGSWVDGISIDGNNVATTGLNISDNDFYDSYIHNVFVDKCSVGFRINENSYSAHYDRIFSGENCNTGLILESRANQSSRFTNCQFLGKINAAIIGTNDPAKADLRVIAFDNCDFTTTVNGGKPIVLYKTGYAIEFKNCWIETGGLTPTVAHMIDLGTSTVAANGITFIDTYFQGNGVVDYVFNWKQAAHISFLGGTKFLGANLGFIDASAITGAVSDSIFLCHESYDPSKLVTGKKIQELFSYCHAEVAGQSYYNKTAFRYDPDAGTATAGNGIPFASKRRSEASPRLQMFEDGLYIGAGVSNPDTRFIRRSADVGGVGVGDSFQVDGTWNGGHFIMGTYHIWVDGSGKLRIKSGAPTSDSDGTVVGTQT